MQKKTPGVYVEEISIFPPSVAQVATAVPAFIGYTEKTDHKGESLLMKPTKIKSFADYKEIYGSANPESFTVAVTTVTNSAGKKLIDDITVTNPATLGRFKMYYALQMFFDNGGGNCYIVSVGDYVDDNNAAQMAEIEHANLVAGLNTLKKEDEPTIIVFPDALDVNAPADKYKIYDNALLQCADLKDRVLVADVDSPDDFRNGIGSGNLKYGAAYYPSLKTIMPYHFKPSAVDVAIDGAAAVKLDTLETTDNQIFIEVKKAIEKTKVELPPSGAMAGLYAYVDDTRGVWKAPANISVTGISEPTVIIDDDEQEDLNVDVTGGKSINAIRKFAGRGNLVWGARTLAGNDNEWRYISVRRFFNMVEESVAKASAQFVFEPNDANTWTKMKAMITNFLILQWRDGALAGATPEDAFFVKVGLGETMTSLDILEGRMNVEIGMAVVRPAEFIILKFSHKMQVS